jgi:flagellar hook-associated protein 3 FlgL
MRIASSSFSYNFLNQIQQLEQQQNTLQEQASSGLKMTLPEDNPSVMAQVLNLQSDAASNTQYQNNITQLQSAATTSGTAMSNLQTLVNQVNDIATEASSGTTASAQLSGYATEMASLIQQAVQLGNTQDSDGNYIFSGTASNTKPFVATTDTDGNITSVSYQGNTDVAESQIASSTMISAKVPGQNTSGSGAAGLFADSRTGADLFSHMIALQQDLSSGNTTAIGATDAPALSKDEDNIINQISANGVMQSALTAAGTAATAQSTNITTQISGDTNANLAQTITALDQTQTAYQAALESGTMVMKLSLLDYLQ